MASAHKEPTTFTISHDLSASSVFLRFYSSHVLLSPHDKRAHMRHMLQKQQLKATNLKA